MRSLAYSFLAATAFLLPACADDNNAPSPDDLGSTAAHDMATSKPDQSMARDLAPAPDAAILPDASILPDLAASDAAATDGATLDGTILPDLTFTCAANAFLMCAGDNAVYCNGKGDGTNNFDCGAPCVGNMGCGICMPNTAMCSQGKLTTCTPQGSEGAPASCVTFGANSGVCLNNTSCEQCTGAAYFCGDGVNYTTIKDTQYSCTNNVLGAPVACAFGCDGNTGKCRDLVPANQAASHLSGNGNEVWTCTGAQTIGLPEIVANAQPVVIDSSAPSITVNGNAVAGVLWGAAYTPANSGTRVRVAHIKRLSIGAGTTVTVKGTFGVVLLVDGAVDINAAQNMPTVIQLAANRSSTGGPGASSTVGTGGAGANAGDMGGGGAGHGTVGGNGGAGNGGNPPGGAAGPLYGAAEILEAGASGGIGGASLQLNNSAGGLGGGALQVTACGAVTVGANVLVNASGGGGDGGPQGSNLLAGGGAAGGGSGGTILVEGLTVAAGGSLVANGGGGGQGGTGGAVGNAGGNWDPSGAIATAAAGGTGGQGAKGGAGGAGNSAAAVGSDGNTGNGGGGGGGAVGAIFLNVSPLAANAVAAASSPAARASKVCVTDKGTIPNGGCMYP